MSNESEARPVDGETADEAPDAESVDLQAYVEENPEEVSRLLERLDVVNELLDIGDVATSAMDDEMVESLAGTGTNLAMAADGMATEEAAQLGEAVGENAGEIAEGIETVAYLQRTGTLDDLAEFADLAALASAAMDDEMITSLSSTGSRLGEIADTASDEQVASGIEDLLNALGEASAGDQEPVGAVGLVRSIRDPDVKAGLGVLLSLARALGAQSRDGAES